MKNLYSEFELQIIEDIRKKSEYSIKRDMNAYPPLYQKMLYKAYWNAKLD